MSNLPEILDTPAPRRAPDRIGTALARSLAALFAETSFGQIAQANLPPEQREMLVARRSELAQSLRPASTERILAILATLGRMIARSETSPEETEFAMRCDVEDLRGVPEWALDEAAAAFRQGRIGDGRFRPTTGELRAEANRRVTPFATEAARIERVLNAAPAPDPIASGERERVKAGLADASKKLTACHDLQMASWAPKRAPDPYVGMSQAEAVEAKSTHYRATPVVASARLLATEACRPFGTPLFREGA